MMVKEFQKRRDYMYEAVNQIPGIQCAKPDGAFYLFPSIKETGMDGFRMAEVLLEKAGVATVAGECFGKKGADHIRISYSNSLENLREAVKKIESVLSEI